MPLLNEKRWAKIKWGKRLFPQFAQGYARLPAKGLSSPGKRRGQVAEAQKTVLGSHPCAMRKPVANTAIPQADDNIYDALKQRTHVPHEIRHRTIARVARTRSMFGCLCHLPLQGTRLFFSSATNSTPDGGKRGMARTTKAATPKGPAAGNSPTCDPSRCWGQR